MQADTVSLAKCSDSRHGIVVSESILGATGINEKSVRVNGFLSGSQVEKLSLRISLDLSNLKTKVVARLLNSTMSSLTDDDVSLRDASLILSMLSVSKSS